MDTPQLLITSADDEVVPDTTTSDEKEVISESASADEKGESESSSGDEKDVSEIAPQEEEEEECGFCLFMKAGPCGDRFKFWQDCVEGAEKSNKDIVEQCAQTTNLLKVCMEMNPQYYGPVLDAEKAMQADIESAEGIRTDGAQSPEPPAEGEDVVAGGNDDQTIEVVERVDVVVDDKGQVVEVEVKASEGTRTDGAQSPEPPAEGEDVVAGGNDDQTIEVVERVDVVVDDKGQVVEVEVKASEGTRTDGAQSPEPPAEGEDVVAGGSDDQTIEVVERVDVVVDDEGQVVEVVDTVEVEVKASEGTRTDGGQSPEPPSEGEGVVESGNGDQTIEAVERVDVVVDEKGQVVEVVDDVEIEIAA